MGLPPRPHDPRRHPRRDGRPLPRGRAARVLRPAGRGRRPGRALLPAPQRAPSETHYNADPHDLIRAVQDLRAREAEILAIYHSHPKWQRRAEPDRPPREPLRRHPPDHRLAPDRPARGPGLAAETGFVRGTRVDARPAPDNSEGDLVSIHRLRHVCDLSIITVVALATLLFASYFVERSQSCLAVIDYHLYLQLEPGHFLVFGQMDPDASRFPSPIMRVPGTFSFRKIRWEGYGDYPGLRLPGRPVRRRGADLVLPDLLLGTARARCRRGGRDVDAAPGAGGCARRPARALRLNGRTGVAKLPPLSLRPNRFNDLGAPPHPLSPAHPCSERSSFSSPTVSSAGWSARSSSGSRAKGLRIAALKLIQVDPRSARSTTPSTRASRSSRA